MSKDTLPDPVPPAVHHGDPRDTHVGTIGQTVPSYEQSKTEGCTCEWVISRDAIAAFDDDCPVFARHRHQPIPAPNTTAEPQDHIGRRGTDPAP